MNILIVEDDPIITDALTLILKEGGYNSFQASNINSALNEMKYSTVDGVILDLNLPDGDGTRLVRLIRKIYIPVPISVVSGNSSVDQRINALGAGADGYLTKPFNKHELLAHLGAIMRRTHGHASSIINIGNLEINLNKHFAAVDEKPVSLTHKEYQILHLLSVRKGAILNKDIFLSHLYGGIDEPESKIIDVFICKLRKKLERAGLKNAQIQTIWGQGYVLRSTNPDADPTSDELEDMNIEIQDAQLEYDLRNFQH